MEHKNPLIIAHRGASIEAPENTMSAITKAIELDVDGIEVDIHQTMDNEFAVIHDLVLGRTIDARGSVSLMRSDELKKLDAGSWFSKEFSQENVPMLRELYEQKIERRLMIEIKTVKSIDNLKEYLDKYCVRFSERKDLLGSFSIKIIQKLVEHFSIDQIVGIADEKESIETFCHMGLKYLAINKKLLTHLRFSEWHKQCLIWVWTVNDQKTARLCCEKNVDAIITDNPRIMKQWIFKQ